MRKDFGAKPFLFPQPVMIIGTYDEEGKANQQGIHCQHGRRGAYDSLRLRGACVWQQGRKQDGEGRIYHNRKRLRPCPHYQLASGDSGVHACECDGRVEIPGKDRQCQH